MRHFSCPKNVIEQLYFMGKSSGAGIVKVWGNLASFNLSCLQGEHHKNELPIIIIDTPPDPDLPGSIADPLIKNEMYLDQSDLIKAIIATSDVDFAQRLKVMTNNGVKVELLSFGYHSTHLSRAVDKILKPSNFIRRSDIRSRYIARIDICSVLRKDKRRTLRSLRSKLDMYKKGSNSSIRFMLSLDPEIKVISYPRQVAYLSKSIA